MKDSYPNFVIPQTMLQTALNIVLPANITYFQIIYTFVSGATLRALHSEPNAPYGVSLVWQNNSRVNRNRYGIFPEMGAANTNNAKLGVQELTTKLLTAFPNACLRHYRDGSTTWMQSPAFGARD
jgi:hypothetical protein